MEIVYAYILPFIVAVVMLLRGEKRTKINPPRDKEEYEGRVFAGIVTMIIFINLQCLLKLLL